MKYSGILKTDITNLKLASMAVFVKIGEYYKSELFFLEDPVVKYLPANHSTLHDLVYPFPAPNSR